MGGNVGCVVLVGNPRFSCCLFCFLQLMCNVVLLGSGTQCLCVPRVAAECCLEKQDGECLLLSVSSIYRKPPNISPGLIFVRKHLYTGGLIYG